MSDKKMLQAILDGQKALKEELRGEINIVREDIKKHRYETKTGFKKVSNRLDMIGESVAFLEDDAPTRDEHDELEKRVTKVENKLQI